MTTERLVGYFPVIHDGYINLLGAYPDADVGVLGNDVLDKRFSYLQKDIRALSSEQAADIVQNGLHRTVQIIGESALSHTLRGTGQIIMPDDDVSHSLADEFDITPIYHPVFLRWDRRNTTVDIDVTPDRIESYQSDDPIVTVLYEEAAKSTNWWRHVAAAVVDKAGINGITHNSSMPTSYTSAIDGDPRITAKRGEDIDRSVDIHAEARLIAQYAKAGNSTKGKSLYVTTFPCSNCAKSIAEAGFSACYFIEGYATLDGQDILKNYNVEIVKLETNIPESDALHLKPYRH